METISEYAVFISCSSIIERWIHGEIMSVPN
jgi:hypothetical protein